MTTKIKSGSVAPNIAESSYKDRGEGEYFIVKC